MGDHLDGSYTHNIFNVPQLHYYGVHTFGPDFDDDMLMTI